MKLKCLSRYRNGPRRIEYDPGKTIEVDAALGAFLLNDAPGSFEVVPEPVDVTDTAQGETQTTALDEPPRTTVIRRAPRTKTTAADESQLVDW